MTIAQNKSCYLSLNDAKNPVYTNKKSKKEGLCEGDEILVQVIKDALKTKDPVVTTKLSIFGSNVILTNFDTQIGVSSKLDKERAALLRKAVLLSLSLIHISVVQLMLYLWRIQEKPPHASRTISILQSLIRSQGL